MSDVFRIRAAGAADASAIAAVHVQSWQSTYHDLLPAEYIARRTLAVRTAMWQRALIELPAGRCCFVAIDIDGHIVGFAAGGPQREPELPFSGELYAIYLLSEVQGEGIGRELVAHVASALAAEGHATLLVWVLASNPACQFYEALGGRRVSQRTVVDEGCTLDEVAYGWEDIHRVGERHGDENTPR